jgi:hypothetical protein
MALLQMCVDYVGGAGGYEIPEALCPNQRPGEAKITAIALAFDSRWSFSIVDPRHDRIGSDYRRKWQAVADYTEIKDIGKILVTPAPNGKSLPLAKICRRQSSLRSPSSVS